MGGLDHRGGVNRFVRDVVNLDIPNFEQKIWRHRDFSPQSKADVCAGIVRFTDVSSVRDLAGAGMELAPLLKYIKSNNPSAIYAHSRMAILALWMLRRMIKTAAIIHLHALPKNTALYRQIIASSNARAVFNSAKTCRHFGFQTDPAYIQTPFIQWPQPPANTGKIRRFVAAGAFVPIKKLDLMISAFRELNKQGPPICELHLFGRSPLCVDLSYQDYISNLASTVPNVKIHDYTPNWANFLQSDDIFLHCAGEESFGIVILEAFSRGLPMIIPSSTFISEFAASEKRGIWELPSVTPDFLMETMKTSLKAPRQCTMTFYADRANKAALFSTEAAIERLLNIFVQVTNQEAGS